MSSDPPPVQSRTFYRVVKTDPPTLKDFMSYEALNKRPLDQRPEMDHLRSGVSVQATEAQARRKARALPSLGTFIAKLVIPNDARIRIERTKGPGHHTLWGEPEAMLACVKPPTVPVRRPSPGQEVGRHA